MLDLFSERVNQIHDFGLEDSIQMRRQLEAFVHEDEESLIDIIDLEDREFNSYEISLGHQEKIILMYKGQYKVTTNLPHGHGLMIDQHANMYEGSFKNGLPNGKVRQIRDNCCVIGTFRGLYPFGQVQIVFKDTSVFNGYI